MKREIVKRCALPSCKKTFKSTSKNRDQKYCSLTCAAAARAGVSCEEQRQKAREERELYDNPLNPPWTPRPKPPPLMTEAEQIDINLACHLRDWQRMERPLTAHVARLMGAAW